MKAGIIGLPGCGKSTVFDLLTDGAGPHDASVPSVKPRMRAVKVHDARLERLAADVKPKKTTPISLELFDFPAVRAGERDRAGIDDLLAPGREMDVLLIVVRGFANPAVPRGEVVDPAGELRDVLSELMLSDLAIADRRLEKLEEKSRRPAFSDADRREAALLGDLKARLEAERWGLPESWKPEDLKRMSGFGFLCAKPYVVALNCETGTAFEELRGRLASAEVVCTAARSELEILELPEEDRKAFLEEYGIREYSKEAVIRALYRAAGRVTFFTTSEKEVRAWSVARGATAVQAAGAVHTDFERGFIRAEVVSYEDYVRHGGFKGAREHGVYRVEGREYIVQDGDIILFRFSV